MDQNQVAGSPDNDLQKAIENITNQDNTKNTTFSDPVAAPSSIPDGDNGELGDPVGPFPMPETDAKVGVVTPGPEPIAPIEPISLPELNVPGENVADAKVVTKPNPEPTPVEPIEPAAPSAPAPEPAQPTPNPADAPAPENPAPEAETPAETPTPITPESLGDMDTLEIKKHILKDLAPLLEHTNADASQKFKIYRDTMEDLHDYSVLDNAYQAASNIQNENERADSLLYLLESIDSIKPADSPESM